MKRKIFGVCLLFLLLGAGVAFSQTPNLFITNETGYMVYNAYLRWEGTQEWHGDILDDPSIFSYDNFRFGILHKGGWIYIPTHKNRRCDIMLVDQDGDYYIIRNFYIGEGMSRANFNPSHFVGKLDRHPPNGYTRY